MCRLFKKKKKLSKQELKKEPDSIATAISLSMSSLCNNKTDVSPVWSNGIQGSAIRSRRRPKTRAKFCARMVSFF